MSYYEKRIAELEARIAEITREQRLKAIPVEAGLIDRLLELKAENVSLKTEVDKLDKRNTELCCIAAKLQTELRYPTNPKEVNKP